MSRPELIDEVGHRYGQWLVVSRAENDKHGQARWHCLCDCGERRVVRGGKLRNGTSQSCGHLTREMLALRSKGRSPANRLPKGEAAFNDLLSNMRRGASNRKHEWGLTKEQVRTLTQQPCHYCGVRPSQCWNRKNLNGTYTYNGIDRQNNELGYTPENTVPCCGTCNVAKNDMPLSEFIAWVNRVHEYLASH